MLRTIARYWQSFPPQVERFDAAIVSQMRSMDQGLSISELVTNYWHARLVWRVRIYVDDEARLTDASAADVLADVHAVLAELDRRSTTRQTDSTFVEILAAAHAFAVKRGVVSPAFAYPDALARGEALGEDWLSPEAERMLDALRERNTAGPPGATWAPPVPSPPATSPPVPSPWPAPRP